MINHFPLLFTHLSAHSSSISRYKLWANCLMILSTFLSSFSIIVLFTLFLFVCNPISSSSLCISLGSSYSSTINQYLRRVLGTDADNRLDKKGVRNDGIAERDWADNGVLFVDDWVDCSAWILLFLSYRILAFLSSVMVGFSTHK